MKNEMYHIINSVNYYEFLKRTYKMKYKYYGTAAAEAIPAIWCDCDTCERA